LEYRVVRAERWGVITGRPNNVTANERIEMNITMYTKDNCPNCVTAKLILNAAGLKYADVDIEVGDRLGNLLKEFPDARQMPQIFINDQRVGGVEGLKVALRQVGVLA
jgi:glutaredoxin 3